METRFYQWKYTGCVGLFPDECAFAGFHQSHHWTKKVLPYPSWTKIESNWRCGTLVNLWSDKIEYLDTKIAKHRPSSNGLFCCCWMEHSEWAYGCCIAPLGHAKWKRWQTTRNGCCENGANAFVDSLSRKCKQRLQFLCCWDCWVRVEWVRCRPWLYMEKDRSTNNQNRVAVRFISSKIK